MSEAPIKMIRNKAEKSVISSGGTGIKTILNSFNPELQKIVGEFKEHTEKYYRHSENVAFICQKLADKLSLNKEESIYLIKAAFLHDLGKKEIDKELLHSIKKYSPEEKQKVDLHVRYGIDLIKEFEPVAAAIIGYHHEFKADFNERNPRKVVDRRQEDSSYSKQQRKEQRRISDQSSEEAIKKTKLFEKLGFILAVVDTIESLVDEERKYTTHERDFDNILSMVQEHLIFDDKIDILEKVSQVLLDMGYFHKELDN